MHPGDKHTRGVKRFVEGGGTRRTLCSKIFLTGHVVHGLEGFSLVAGEGLLIVVFAGAAETVEDDAAGVCAARYPEDEDDEGDQNDGAE